MGAGITTLVGVCNPEIGPRQCREKMPHLENVGDMWTCPRCGRVHKLMARGAAGPAPAPVSPLKGAGHARAPVKAGGRARLVDSPGAVAGGRK